MSVPIDSWITAWKVNSLQEWLRYFAVDTWNRIAFCRKDERNNIFETTITQNMVYQFFQLQRLRHFPVEIEESTNERVNGNDLEIIIKTQYGYLLLPCQCKIIDKNGRYSTIGHKTNGKPQIDSLLAYAKSIKGLPIYLLYNCNSDLNINKQIVAAWQSIPVEAFGCSFTDAHYLQIQYMKHGSWTIPTFDELHLTNNAFPFEIISLFGNISFTADYLNRFSAYLNFVTELPHHLYQPRLSNQSWRSLIPPASIGRINPTDNAQDHYSRSDTVEGFAPSFRVIFNMDWFKSQ